MSRMVIDDEMWSRLEKLLPKPKGRHGEDDRLFMEAIGACVGGLSTKIHAKVDSFGHLVNVLITPGQVHESQVAHDVWAHEYCECFLADKAYDIDGVGHHQAQ